MRKRALNKNKDRNLVSLLVAQLAAPRGAEEEKTTPHQRGESK